MGVPAPKIKMVVITPDVMMQWLIEIEEGKRSPEAYWAFDENNYLALAQWMQDLLRHTKAQNAVIEAYENEANTFNNRLNE